MKTVICINETCTQNGVEEFYVGAPDVVKCGVCRADCQLSEEYDDPELPVMGQPEN
jgi:hypothetical protein